jgi:PAS domain S-box-containing protein
MAQTPSLSILRQLIEGTDSVPSRAPHPVPVEEKPAVSADAAPPIASPPEEAPKAAAPVAVPTPKPASETVTQPKTQAPPRLPIIGHADHCLKILAENAPLAMAIFDADMKYLYANQRWMEFFKLEQTEVVGRSQYEIFPALHPGWRHVYERALSGQVVRSDRDTVNQAGRPVLYRWEVRPWRSMDAAVRGVMITCLSIPGVQSRDIAENAPPAAPVAAAETNLSVWDLPLPMVALDAEGRVCRWSTSAGALFLSDGLIEGQTAFWELFGEPAGAAPLRSATLQAVHGAAAGAREINPLVIPDSTAAEASHIPGVWHIVPLASPAEHAGVVALAIGLPRPQPVAVPVVEARKDSEVEKLLRQREARLRSVLDVAPSGLLVLDEQGRPVFHNMRAAALLGRVMKEDQTVEDWLAQSCRDDQHRDEVVRLWREGVWRKQLTRTLTLTAADGVLKEIELRPASIPGGGMLVMLNDVTEERRAEELLRAMEAKFRALVHENPLPIVLSDRSGMVFEANAAAESLTGRTRAELRRVAMEEWLCPDSRATRTAALREMAQRGDFSTDLDVMLHHSEGQEVAAGLRIAAVPDASGQPAGTIHFFQPVGARATDLEKAEPPPPPEPEVPPTTFLKLPSNVELLATDYHGRITQWSEDAERCFGLGHEEAVGRGLHTLFRPSDASGFYADLGSATADGMVQPVEWMFLHHEQGRRPGVFTLKPSEEGGLAVSILSEQQEEPPQEDFMGEAATPPVDAPLPPPPSAAQQLERERFLVGETHHRVKNHLQIITSMLNLQLSMMQNEEAREALRSSQNRVRSIADLHHHLFGLAVGEGGSFAEFAQGLIGHLRDCYDIREDRVAIDLDMADAAVPEEWLMPLALSLNEMVSNAFKHAYPEGRGGRLNIAMKWNPQDGELLVQDDGIGMPEDFEQRHFSGLGMKILRVFAGQLGGEVRISSEPDRGSAFCLHFPQAR